LKIGTHFLGNKFIGVYPADRIPKLTEKQPYAIANLDQAGMPGSHWISLCKHGKNIVVYDSFGRSSTKIIPDLLKSGTLPPGGKLVDTDRDPEQKVSQYNCGQRAISWLILTDRWGIDFSLLI
jgi:hypothetical protein